MIELTLTIEAVPQPDGTVSIHLRLRGAGETTSNLETECLEKIRLAIQEVMLGYSKEEGTQSVTQIVRGTPPLPPGTV